MRPGVNIPWQDKHSGLLPDLEPCTMRVRLPERLSAWPLEFWRYEKRVWCLKYLWSHETNVLLSTMQLVPPGGLTVWPMLFPHLQSRHCWHPCLAGSLAYFFLLPPVAQNDSTGWTVCLCLSPAESQFCFVCLECWHDVGVHAVLKCSFLS